jgi:hypothetical protein
MRVIFRDLSFFASSQASTFNSGWHVDKHVSFVADMTGDGTGDLIGFGDGGVIVAANNGNNTFRTIQTIIEDFGYNAGGWRIDRHPRLVVDLLRSGRVDILGFGDSGVQVSFNRGNLAFDPAELVLNDFGYLTDWRTDRHLRFLGDLNGDGFPDIIGFGEHSVYVSFNNHDGTFTPPDAVLQDMCIGAGGWEVNKHPRFIADLSGNKQVDLVGFHDDGVYVSLNDSNGLHFSPATMVVNDFCYNNGWRIEKHPRFIVDVTGDGKGDIVGFGENGVIVSLNNGDGTFKPPKLVVEDFGYNAGHWRVDRHRRYVVDLTGDGCADILGFGDGRVLAAFNLGNGEFGPATELVGDFSAGQGCVMVIG